MHSAIRSQIHHWCFLLCTFAAASALSAPVPAWVDPDFPQRAVFRPTPYARGFVTVQVPIDDGVGEHAAALAYGPGGESVPVDTIHTDRDTASFLVRYGHAKRGSFSLYYGRTNAPPERTLRDPDPVLVEAYKFYGTSVPNSWSKMLYLYQKARRPRMRQHRPDFKPGPLHQDAEQKTPPRSILRMQTYVHCPTSGVYRFSLGCVNSGFLLIDGEMAHARPGIHPADGARPGPPQLLSEGLHRLEVFNDITSQLTVTLRWQPPWLKEGAPAEPIPPHLLIAAHEARDVRVERTGKTLHPSFTFDLMQSYSFRGSSMIYTPVTLRDTSQNWISRNFKFNWRAGAGQQYSGRIVEAILAGNGPHRVELDVRDELGFVATATRMIALDPAVPNRYPLEAVMEGLPAVLFAADRVAPWLRVSGKVPPTIPLEGVCVMIDNEGSQKEIRNSVELNGIEDARVELPWTRASDLREIQWRVEHAGAPMVSGAIHFESAPFARIPVRTEEDRLYDADGARVVLVPTRYGGEQRQPAITTDRAFGTLLCVDDALSAPGARQRESSAPFETRLTRIVDGPDRPEVRYSTLSPWESAPNAYGPLLKLVEIPSSVDDDVTVVVLCVGLQDILGNVSVAEFERNAAALSDIVTTGMQRPVVWATPLPSSSSPGVVRDYAAAIRRVADARRIPVADLYSAIRGADDGTPLVTDSPALALTDAGHRLTADLIARALLAN